MIFLGFLSLAMTTFAQPASILGELRPEIQVITRLNPMPSDLVLPMGFASATITSNLNDWESRLQFKQVDLLFTLYPRDPSTWKVGYDNLLERRFRNLDARIPGILADTSIHWRLLIQTDCNSMASARGLFHGFVLHPREDVRITSPKDSAIVEEPKSPRFDSLLLKSNLDRVAAIISEDRGNHDSTALNLLTQHSEWKNSLVVIDWTASMYRQGALLINWQQKVENRGKIKHFVFFNDGDGKFDDEKIIGETGGIYECAADTLPKMWPTIQAVTLGGEGGDHRENDIEAILAGLQACPDCDQVILIADNSGPVRDISLQSIINKPVHIFLCNAYKDDIETDYLEIAYRTQGSIQTKNHELRDLPSICKGGILQIGEAKYAIRSGKFRKLRN